MYVNWLLSTIELTIERGLRCSKNKRKFWLFGENNLPLYQLFANTSEFF